MDRAGSRPVRREQGPYREAGRGGGTPPRRGYFGRPDWFVWIPVAALLLAAVILATIASSTEFAVGALAVAVVLVVFDSFMNR
ncbi:hypothetical protein [Nocardia huaxiensis]|uniref:Uncharacterized protein n=1 Tax=Nocardia huaxiensis TaxID=2755382 RepID=A0A7D6ZDZ4_9NOCA|nr:hypothetical protein [Nocardia huaxiensis]QLY28659.1 hypothetical protein H0264_25395 [Nocardia huaxiensis]UFS97869.1 hypothetical protein LPY97_08205 [Nocardia huaxiensis]